MSDTLNNYNNIHFACIMFASKKNCSIIFLV